MERIGQRLGQVGLRHGASIRLHEDVHQETGDQRRRIGRQQALRGMLASQGFQGVEVELHDGDDLGLGFQRSLDDGVSREYDRRHIMSCRP
jgi:hypothetical protein